MIILNDGLTTVLEEVGFTNSEARVYLALLSSGQSLVGNIIKKTGFHRATTYQLLQRLIEKGFASNITINNKQHFEAIKPNQLINFLKEKEDLLQTALPKLNLMHSKDKNNQITQVYTGVKGIKSVLDSVLQELTPNGTYYDFGVSGLFFETMETYWTSWQKRKKQFNIQSKVIFNEDLRQKNSKIINQYFGEARFYPKKFSSLTDTIIYNDTTILILWTANPPIAIKIINKDNAISYKNQFMYLWKNAHKY